MRILGIDPGTSRMGYGLIEANGSLKLIKYGTIETSEKLLKDKIFSLSVSLNAILKELAPELVAVEKLFFSKNRKTALDVAQARGAILSILTKTSIPIVEYSPNEVKLQVTGYGFTDKLGVAKMVKAILGVDELAGHDDASDALAVAITAANMRRLYGGVDTRIS
ncbi:MAG: crossover junction endodeoxyribonuclease RuvC [Candidatus Harrisonbacteria bacterium]|nr:crossover junction endodeoxyribonuclease RuvC [Candidatus Harrisonbacteria bacterium]